MSKIENIRFADDQNNSVEINVGLGATIYPFTISEDGQTRKYQFLPGKVTEVRWSYQGNETSVKSNTSKSIFAYPSVDGKFVIVIYQEFTQEFPVPCNAVVYKADGSVHLILNAPELGSDLAKERGANANKEEMWYQQVMWVQNKNGQLADGIKIGFDRDWYEVRAFSPETGELKEVLESGRL